jgi:spore germination cell wall hydrolase CwlJ-like protein
MFGRFRAGLIAAATIALSFLAAAPAIAAGADASVPDLRGLAPAVSVQAPAAPAAQSQPSLADLVRSAPAQGATAQPATIQPTQSQPPLTLAGRTLHDLVIAFVNYGNQDEEQLCLAKAVYFEARGETLEGQLAVAEVVLNRARSGRYPPSICGVVTQPAQFSFIRAGRFPAVDPNSECWKKALAIADAATRHLAASLAPNVLWYHATYVAPAWGRQKTRAAQIGTHIFYS